MNGAYEVQKHLPNALAIGDNEGGAAIVYVADAHGVALYRSSFGCLDKEELQFLANSLAELLQQGANLPLLA